MGSGYFSNYSFTYSLSSVDFYGNDPSFPKINITIDSSLAAQGTKVSNASASLSASATSSATTIKTTHVDPDLLGNVATITVAVHIRTSNIFLDGTTSLSISSEKTAYASASLSGSVSSSSVLKKTTTAYIKIGKFKGGLDWGSYYGYPGDAILINPVYPPGSADYFRLTGPSSDLIKILELIPYGDTIDMSGSIVARHPLWPTVTTLNNTFEVYEVMATSTDVYVIGNSTTGNGIASGYIKTAFGTIAYGDVPDSNLSATAHRVFDAASAVSFESNFTSSGTRVVLVDSGVSGSASLSALTLKQAYASGLAETIQNVELSATTYKLAYSASSQSINSDITATSVKDAYASSALSGSASSSITALEILFGAADLTSTTVTVAASREILLADLNISASGNISISGLTRFSESISKYEDNVLEDLETIRTLVSIDGKPLTEHNRKLDSFILQSFAENQNWKATRSRYYKNSGGRKSFQINWTMLPGEKDDTVDKRFGRNKIKEIARDPDIHTLKILNSDSDGTTPYTETEYTVVVKGYSEKLVRRNISNNIYLWDCTIQLEEV